MQSSVIHDSQFGPAFAGQVSVLVPLVLSGSSHLLGSEADNSIINITSNLPKEIAFINSFSIWLYILLHRN